MKDAYGHEKDNHVSPHDDQEDVDRGQEAASETEGAEERERAGLDDAFQRIHGHAGDGEEMAEIQDGL